MNLLRLTAWLTFAQCFITGAAFASPALPEPASLTLLGVGMGGIAIVRKLRRRK